MAAANDALEHGGSREARGGSAILRVPGDYGGEEFILIFPDCDPEQARRICERIRSHIAEVPVQTTSAQIPVTMSLGIAVFTPESPVSADELIQSADEALYASKRDGRNRVTQAPNKRG